MYRIFLCNSGYEILSILRKIYIHLITISVKNIFTNKVFELYDYLIGRIFKTIQKLEIL